MLKFQLQRSQDLVRIDKQIISADTTYLVASFSFSPLLSGNVTSYWRRDESEYVYKAVLDSNGQCRVPWEVLVHRDSNKDYGGLDHIVYVSLADENIITTNECMINIARSVYSDSASDSDYANYVIGRLYEHTIPVEAWNGTSYTFTTSDFGEVVGLQIGIPPTSSYRNAHTAIQCALTIPYFSNSYVDNDADGIKETYFYTTIVISAKEQPKTDVKVAIWALAEKES